MERNFYERRFGWLMLDDGQSYSLTSSISSSDTAKSVNEAMNILLQELQKLLESVKGRLTSDELEAYRLIFKELEDLKNK